jgi:hypothetical protein
MTKKSPVPKANSSNRLDRIADEKWRDKGLTATPAWMASFKGLGM